VQNKYLKIVELVGKSKGGGKHKTLYFYYFLLKIYIYAYDIINKRNEAKA
jgi:hypothetical protein